MSGTDIRYAATRLNCNPSLVPPPPLSSCPISGTGIAMSGTDIPRPCLVATRYALRVTDLDYAAT
eukprot:2117665-Rhodomonas_salina.1